MSVSSSDDDSIPPPPPPPPPMPPAAAAEEELEIQMTPVLERINQQGIVETEDEASADEAAGGRSLLSRFSLRSSKSKQESSPTNAAARASPGEEEPLTSGSGFDRPGSRASSKASSGYAGEQVELDLDKAPSKLGGSQDEMSHELKEGGGRRCQCSGKKKWLVAIASLVVVGAVVGGALGATLGKKQEKAPGDAAGAESGPREVPTSTTLKPTPQPVPGAQPAPPLEEISGTRPPASEGAAEKEAVALAALERNVPAESYAAVADAGLATPQNEALNWVLYDDSFAYDWEGIAAGDAAAETAFVQRYALATLYAVLNGPEWDESENWRTGADVCEWYGVECVGESDGGEAGAGTSARALRRRDARYGTLGNGNEEGADRGTRRLQLNEGAVRALRLVDNGLEGWLPPDLSSLADLEEIEMHRNKIYGEIPPHIYGMVQLTTLFLDDNRLGGTIATEIGTMQNLDKLTLNDNDFQGEISSEIGNLGKLTMLWLFNNGELGGSIPTEVGRLTNLSEYRAFSCSRSVLALSWETFSVLARLPLSQRPKRCPASFTFRPMTSIAGGLRLVAHSCSPLQKLDMRSLRLSAMEEAYQLRHPQSSTAHLFSPSNPPLPFFSFAQSRWPSSTQALREKFPLSSPTARTSRSSRSKTAICLGMGTRICTLSPASSSWASPETNLSQETWWESAPSLSSGSSTLERRGWADRSRTSLVT
ncbi:hypothetical protein ACHAWF_010096 [Thalassiosira exigua]